MARKIIKFTAESGRDKDKVFVITEMPASQAEKWAMRAFLAISKSGVEVPAGIEMETGFAGIAKLGLTFISKLPFDVAEPLMDEMMGCVKIQPNATNPSVVRELIEDDIEEVATRIKIRLEVFKLHAGFLNADNE